MNYEFADFTDEDVNLMKDYFDDLSKGNKSLELFNGPPDEARDWHGRWTEGGSTGGTSVKENDFSGKEESREKETQYKPTKREIRLSGDVQELNKGIREVFGKSWSHESLADLAGGLEDTDVRITRVQAITGNPYSPDKNASIHISWDSYYGAASRTIQRDNNGNLVMHNNYFSLEKQYQGEGIGVDVLNSQINNAQKMGVSRIETDAARDDEDGYVGYKVWPKFGYDGDIPEKLVGFAPNGEKRISQLMRTKQGREWWAKNGDSTKMSFDLTPGSYSMKVWEAYKSRKMAENKDA